MVLMGTDVSRTLKEEGSKKEETSARNKRMKCAPNWFHVPHIFNFTKPEATQRLGSLFQHDSHLSQMTPGEDGEGSPSPPDFY